MISQDVFCFQNPPWLDLRLNSTPYKQRQFIDEMLIDDCLIKTLYQLFPLVVGYVV